MFRRRGRTMPERNRVQAMLPAGAEALPNECGTAPGVWMRLGGAHVAAMPGVPSEMYVMFEKQVKPRLAGARAWPAACWCSARSTPSGPASRPSRKSCST